MTLGWRITITFAFVAAMSLLWLVDDRLSRRPGYRRKMRLWADSLIERERGSRLQRPTFLIWAAMSGVLLLALLWSVR